MTTQALLKPEAAAEYLSVSVKQLRALTVAGRIRYVNIGLGEKRETRRCNGGNRARPSPGFFMGAIAASMPWRRTWPDRQYDFTFERDGATIGRIYRHHDKNRWQWFRWRPETATGICDTKDEAARSIDDGEPDAG